MRAVSVEHNEADVIEDSPTYRVQFWTAVPGMAHQLDAWILSDVDDVASVISWTEARADGRRVEIFAEWREVPTLEGSRTEGLLRLRGTSPIDEPSPPA